MSERMHELHEAGQSVWLDYIDRTMLSNGDLETFINEDELMGMTSNPTIFEKALAEGTAYDEQVASVDEKISVNDAFETIAATDVRDACDVFRSVYDKTDGVDGYVSLEVSPKLARDYRGNDRRSKATLETGRPTEPHDQGARHSRGCSSSARAHRLGNQRERHASLCH